MTQLPLTYAIGIMSGTSADGLDAALVSFCSDGDSVSKVQLVDFVSHSYQARIRALLLKNMEAKTSSVAEICDLNILLSQLAAKLVKKLLVRQKLAAVQVSVIGYHGQTMQHRPETHATLQIGDGPTLAYLTEIPVVNNFRTKDMAAGGQGAPLVPFAHRLLFGEFKNKIAIHNLGGISNITYLSPQKQLAFDTGPANMLIDALAQKLFQKKFDKSGALARRGHVDANLVKSFLCDAFFAKKPPKSTGREAYGATYAVRWLKQAQKMKLTPIDLLATATQFTAESIALAYQRFILPYGLDQVVFCGGGAKNTYLISLIKKLLPVPVLLTSDYGLAPQSIEAIAFALLGYFALLGKPNQIAALTGGRHDLSLGQIAFSI